MSASAEIKTLPIPVALIDHLRPSLGPHIDRALAASLFDPVEMTADLIAGRAVLWAVFDQGKPTAALFTSCHAGEADDAFLFVYGLGGTGAKRWANPVLRSLEQHARHNGCAFVRFYGRKAWAKVAKNYHPVASDGETPLFERALV